MTDLSSLPKRTKTSYLDKFQKEGVRTNLYSTKFQQSGRIYIFYFNLNQDIPLQFNKLMKKLIQINKQIISKYIGPFIYYQKRLYALRWMKSIGNQIPLTLHLEGKQYNLSIKLLKEVKLSDWISVDKSKSQSAIYFLNCLFVKIMKQNGYTKTNNNKFFNLTKGKDVNYPRCIIYQGYQAKFKALQSGIYLNLDICFKICQKQKVIDKIHQIYKQSIHFNKKQKRQILQNYLIGKQVMTIYGKNKIYTIQSIIFDQNEQTYVFKSSNRSYSLRQYYKQVYNIVIMQQNQPLIKAKSLQKDIILMPELLLMCGISDDLDQNQKKHIKRQIAIEPHQRLRGINSFVYSLRQIKTNLNLTEIQENIGIRIDHQPIFVQSYKLPNPNILLGNKKQVQKKLTTHFPLFKQPIYCNKNKLRLTIFHNSHFQTKNLQILVIQTCRKFQIQIKTQVLSIDFTQRISSIKTIQALIKRSIDSSNMFWIILPDHFKQHYKQIKNFSLNSYIQTSTQITLQSSLNKKQNIFIISRIVLQMAAKIGNVLWNPKISNVISKANIIMIGIYVDFYYSQKQKIKIISYCSNVNHEFSQFNSNFIAEKQKYLNSGMKQIICDSLNSYINLYHENPQEIVIIRNGKTKNDQWYKEEIQQTRQMLRNISKSIDSIKLTFLQLVNNPSLKVFSQKQLIKNPTPGILINSKITTKDQYQFYIIGQIFKGTIRPILYRQLFSDSKLDQGVIEQLIYHQSFNYANFTGLTKVPAVIQYAKKQAQFIIKTKQTIPPQNLLHNPYYI